MSATLTGGFPTAWQYADARASCGFFLQRIVPEAPGEVEIPPGQSYRVTDVDVCGRCGQFWACAWAGYRFGSNGERYRHADQHWLTVWNHCLDHLWRMEPES